MLCGIVRKREHFMKSEREDRRVRRTRRLLRDALLALMRERHYDDITVQDILDRADVGRSTFYAHFYDKEDLLLTGLQEIRDLFDRRGDVERNGEGSLSLDLFRHVRQYEGTYRALAGNRAGEQVLQHVHRSIAEHLQERLERFVPAEQELSPPRDVLVAYLENTLVALLRWWLERGAAYSPEQMSVMFRSLVLPGLLAALPIERERAEGFF